MKNIRIWGGRQKNHLAIRLLFFFILALIFYGLYGNNLQMLWWNPSAEGRYLHAEGRFLREKSAAIKGSIEAPYVFKSDDGRLISLNCEPYPPINKCLSNQNIGSGVDYIYNRVSINYFNTRIDEKKTEYNLLMSVIFDNNNIIKYSNRLNYIKLTTVESVKNGDRRRLPPSSISIFVLLPMLIFLFVACCVWPIGKKSK